MRQPFEARYRLRRQREQRDVAAARVSRRPRDGDRVTEAREGFRSDRLQWDETLEALRQHVVRRHRERRLVALPALERCAVRDGEERDTDADDEECRRDDRGAAAPGERDRGEPHGQRSLRATQGTKDGHEQPRREDRRGEDDERRKQQQERPGAAADRVGVRISARDGEQDRRDCADRCHVRGRQRPAAERRDARAKRSDDDGGRDDGEHNGECKPMPREQRMRKHRAGVGAQRPREQRGEAGTCGPADADRDEGDERGLHGREGRELRPACSRPRQPPTRVVGIASPPRSCEHGEREQQHGDVAADQQEPLSCDACLRVHRRERVERRRDAEDRIDRRESNRRVIDAAREPGDLPVVKRSRRDRQHPPVRARDQLRVGKRCAPERERTFGQEQRRCAGAAAAEVRAQWSVLRERAASDDVQERQSRQTPATADEHELTALRRAPPRQPAASEPDPPPEAVDAAEVHERSAELRLPEERHAERPTRDDRRQRTTRVRVEARNRHRRLRRHAAPHDLQRRVGRPDARELLRHGAVTHGRAAAGGEREHRRTRGDPERDERSAARCCTKTDECEPDRIRRAPEPRAVHPTDRRASRGPRRAG